MKVYYLATDPSTPIEKRPRSGLMQGRQLEIDEDEVLSDGPTSSRVAVVDIDDETGETWPGAKYQPDGPRRKLATHQVSDKSDIFARDFQQVSVFGAVHATMDLFEGPGILGRKLTWAFDAQQLKVVPRAGVKANAQYSREKRSLEFFFFDGVIGGIDTRVYTCLSPDIVAHETAHAILDGLAPDLYNATSPLSLSLHEAVSDVTAMLFAARSSRLARLVLKSNHGDLRQPGAFNAVAEQFGQAKSGRLQPLRDLLNDKRLRDVRSSSPHDLSEVLTGAIYEMFLQSYSTELDEQQAEDEEGRSRYSLSGRVLANVADRTARIAFRALDYLPPGEVTFADYVRAVVSADAASNPDSPDERTVLVNEAVKRGIIERAEDAEPVIADLDLNDVELDALYIDNDMAHAFVEQNRKALFVPEGAEFAIRPRLDVSKETYRRNGKRAITRELILKLTWTDNSFSIDRGGNPVTVQIRYGTTLVLDWVEKSIRAVLTTSESEHVRADRATDMALRTKWLGKLLDDGLDLDEYSTTLGDGTLAFHGLARQLHLHGR
ncbi:hypothetical protein [Ruegeria meonggei]|uniref:hypothetical protein n=1 Tax=Ruegeria meonggei TaxID=1446476 RepID=UPI003673441B